jgi:putative NIF3 family GTP cyclohydrolase 1 type 2
MNVQEIFDLGLKLAKKADLRGEKKIQDKLKRLKDKYQKLSQEEKEEFDTETLTNPYADSRILFAGPKNKQIKKVMAGIDIGSGELLIAKELGVDLVISHHPLGHALAGLDEVMHMQIELLAQVGIPINIAHSLIKIRASEVNRSVGVANHYRVVDAAKMLNIPLICTHTIADNLVTKFLNVLLKKNERKMEYLSDVMKMLKDIPEYKIATRQKAGPTIFAGSPDDYCGRVIITEMTGGTTGSKEIYEKMSQAGIGTTIGMHMHEEWKKEAEKNNINVVIAGHISSDSIGMNLYLDQLERKGIKIIPCSGLIRVSRI